MANSDEPLFEDHPSTAPPSPTGGKLPEQIAKLMKEQEYAVLSVQAGGQPYGALVAFACSEDLRHVVFGTPTSTVQFRSLNECDHVALVVDNRPGNVGKMMEVEAITATGRAQLIERGDQFDRWSQLLVEKHSYLKSFVQAATCALFRVDVIRYFHVVRFQEVRQWIPPQES